MVQGIIQRVYNAFPVEVQETKMEALASAIASVMRVTARPRAHTPTLASPTDEGTLCIEMRCIPTET